MDDKKKELLDTDDEFRRLHEEHQGLERRLEELLQKSFPTEDDELEEKRIKLSKLRLKDRMEEIARAHQGDRVSV